MEWRRDWSVILGWSSSCGTSSLLRCTRALDLLGTMEKLGIVDKISYSSAITACGRAQMCDRALEVLNRAETRGMKLDAQVSSHSPLASRHPPPATRHSPLATRHLPLATHNSPLATRHSPLATRHVRACVGRGQRACAPVCSQAYNAAIDACEKEKRWQTGLEILSGMRQRGVMPNEVRHPRPCHTRAVPRGQSGGWRPPPHCYLLTTCCSPLAAHHVLLTTCSGEVVARTVART